MEQGAAPPSDELLEPVRKRRRKARSGHTARWTMANLLFAVLLGAVGVALVVSLRAVSPPMPIRPYPAAFLDVLHYTLAPPLLAWVLLASLRYVLRVDRLLRRIGRVLAVACCAPLLVAALHTVLAWASEP